MEKFANLCLHFVNLLFIFNLAAALVSYFKLDLALEGIHGGHLFVNDRLHWFQKWHVTIISNPVDVMLEISDFFL